MSAIAVLCNFGTEVILHNNLSAMSSSPLVFEWLEFLPGQHGPCCPSSSTEWHASPALVLYGSKLEAIPAADPA